jgi:hypothetical protein
LPYPIDEESSGDEVFVEIKNAVLTITNQFIGASHDQGEKEENSLIMNNRYATHTQALIDAVLNSPGETDPGLRHAVEAQSAQLSGRPSQHAGHVRQELVPYLKKVALYAYRTTDKDFEALRRVGYSEDEIFELTLSAALGAGMARLECGLAALKGGQDAASED